MNTPIVHFGESVLCKLMSKVAGNEGDFRDKFVDAIWLGCTIRSGEHVVATSQGVYLASTISRKSADQRWCADAVANIIGTPQNPTPNGNTNKLTALSRKNQS